MKFSGKMCFKIKSHKKLGFHPLYRRYIFQFFNSKPDICLFFVFFSFLYKNQETEREAEYSDFLTIKQSQNVLILFLFEICTICVSRDLCHIYN